MRTKFVIENHGPLNIEVHTKDGKATIPAYNKRVFRTEEDSAILIQEAVKPKVKD